MSILGTLVEEKQDRDKLSDRAVARAVKTSPTTVGRVKRGFPVDKPTLEKFARWLGVPPSTLLDADAVAPATEKEIAEAQDLAVQLKALLASHPQLYTNFQDIVRGINAGELPIDILADAIRFATFKVSEDQRGSGFIGSRTGTAKGG